MANPADRLFCAGRGRPPLLLALLTMSLAGLACRKTQPPSAAPVPSGAAAGAAAVVVSIERAAYRAAWPVYDVVLHDDGHVRYQGRAFTAAVGPQSRTVPDRTLQRVRELVGRDRMADVPADCCDTGRAGQTIKLTIGPPLSRTVRFVYRPHAEGVQGRLSRLADDLDVLLGTRQFVGATLERDRATREPH